MAEANVITLIPQINFPLKIVNLSKLIGTCSPEVMVYGIPWKVKVRKDTFGGEQCLSVYLNCAITNKSPEWTHVAGATFKLQPLSGKEPVIESLMEPYVFDCLDPSFGFPSFIKWNELLDAENNYVKDDTVTLLTSIDVADPKAANPSKLLFQAMGKCCDGSCSNKYQLSVINIENLMAVKSQRFTMRNSSWFFRVYKDLSQLGIALHNRSILTEMSCKVEISLKVVSTKNAAEPVEPAANSAVIKRYGILSVTEIISWDDLLKPENGFVNDNSIVIEVEIKACKPKGIAPNDPNEPKRLKLECAICLEGIDNDDITSTPCGHLFCSGCIKNSVDASQKCPSCNVAVTLDSLHRIYLPM